MKTKTFNCVEMKRRGAEKVQQVLAGMTFEEELAFWQQGTEALQEHQRHLRAAGEIETLPLPATLPMGRQATRSPEE